MGAPSRYSFATFCRVAEVIGAACEQFPKSLVISPKNMTADSYAQLLRNGLRSWKLYKWHHYQVDERRLNQILDLLLVSVQADGRVCIGPRNRTETVAYDLDTGKVGLEIEVTHTLPNLESVCQLVSGRALTPMPKFVVRGLTKPEISSLESRHDVAFRDLGEGLHEIL